MVFMLHARWLLGVVGAVGGMAKHCSIYLVGGRSHNISPCFVVVRVDFSQQLRIVKEELGRPQPVPFGHLERRAFK